MSELKTLNDMKCRGNWINDKGELDPKIYVDYDELRQEAIKAIKDAERNRTVNGDVFTSGRIFELKRFCDIEDDALVSDGGKKNV